MSASSLSDEPTGVVLDLVTPALSNEITKLDERLHVVQGLLDALARLHEVNKSIQFSRDRASASIALQHEPFNYSRSQVEALLAMPMSWQTSDQADHLRTERDQLVARKANLQKHATEPLSLHWFG